MHYLMWLKSLVSLHASKYYKNTLELSPVWQGLSISWSSFYEDHALFDMQHAFSKRITSCILETSANSLLTFVPEKHQKTHSPRTILNLQYCVWKHDLIFDCEITACVYNYLHQTRAMLCLMLTCAPDALIPQLGDWSYFTLSSSVTSYL